MRVPLAEREGYLSRTSIVNWAPPFCLELRVEVLDGLLGLDRAIDHDATDAGANDAADDAEAAEDDQEDHADAHALFLLGPARQIIVVVIARPSETGVGIKSHDAPQG